MTVILINRNGIGQGPQELQQLLLFNYISQVLTLDHLPEAICFYAEGVLVFGENNPALEQLLILEQKGVNLILCKTCVNYFNLTDKITAGTVSTMLDIVELQMNADKVITL